jgi:hypothetical protein
MEDGGLRIENGQGAFARLGHLLSATIHGWKKIPVLNLARRL